ncbi:MAG TPA: PH domain-containing protein [Woeseiaceae bacterium]|nr:PH domain-containing protein [Woeseiaceae bacterium]
MKRTDAECWQRTSPYSVLFFFGGLVKRLARHATQVIAPIAAFFIAWQGDLQSKIVLAAVALTFMATASALLAYLTFYYRVDEEAIRIRYGVFQKRQLDIRFDRVQSVTTEQNPVYRALGLVSLTFDTAGSSKDEGVLPAIPVAEAEVLRNRIGRVDLVVADTATPAAAAAPGELLLALGGWDMVRIGLADWRALVLLAVLGPLFERAGNGVTDRIGSRVADSMADVAKGFQEFGVAPGLVVLIALISVLVTLFGLLSIFAAFLRYHRFRLSRDGQRLRSVAGLLTRHENVTHVAKVQILSLRQGLVLRLFRRLRIVAKQARSGSGDRDSRHFQVPLVTPGFAGRFTRLVFDREAQGLDADPWHSAFARVSPHYLRARLLPVALAPAAVACLVIVPGAGWAAAWALLWIPIGALLAFQAWRRTAFRLDRDGIVRRSGLLGVRLDALLFRKVQRVSIRQSWFQRRRRLANLSMFTASGAITLPHIDHATACRLRDYILYRVESSRQAWH